MASLSITPRSYSLRIVVYKGRRYPERTYRQTCIGVRIIEIVIHKQFTVTSGIISTLALLSFAILGSTTLEPSVCTPFLRNFFYISEKFLHRYLLVSIMSSYIYSYKGNEFHFRMLFREPLLYPQDCVCPPEEYTASYPNHTITYRHFLSCLFFYMSERTCITSRRIKQFRTSCSVVRGKECPENNFIVF